jgi:16S rRNA (cytosine967-C5)-methyltransferase
LRRNPDIKWRASKKKLKKFYARQLRLIEKASRLVKPSGILVYAVCSSEPEENEMVVRDFLKNHKAFVIGKESGRLPENLLSMADQPGAIETFPRLRQMDGFYCVRLQRIP